VSDIGLPDRSGVDLVRKLREERPVAAVALRGYGTKSDVARSRDAGF
jgi:CheY-like chemotaxis protein